MIENVVCDLNEGAPESQTQSETKLNDAQKTALIVLVQREKALWDMEHKDYSTRRTKVKDVLWQKIATEMNLEVKVVIAGWKNLRTQFKKEIQKTQPAASGSGADEEGDGPRVSVYSGQWGFFESLKFLAKVVTPREMTGNLDRNQPSAAQQPSTQPSVPSTSAGARTEEVVLGFGDLSEDLEVDDFEGMEETSQRDVTTVFTPRTNYSNAKKRVTPAQRISEIELKKIKLYQERERNKQIENDEDMLFLKSLHSSVRKVHDKLKFRADMIKLVQDFIEMEELMINE